MRLSGQWSVPVGPLKHANACLGGQILRTRTRTWGGAPLVPDEELDGRETELLHSCPGHRQVTRGARKTGT